jgi:hypothetical protein
MHGPLTAPTPRGRGFDVIAWIFLGLMTAAFWQAPGTQDVGAWLDWAKSVAGHGLVAGYAEAGSDYPPLAFLILDFANQLAPLTQRTFFALKLLNALALIATLLVAARWSREQTLPWLLVAAVFVNAVWHIYIDVWYAPLLLLAMWNLSRERWLGFACAFSLAVFVKWQPLVLAPFLLFHLLGRVRLHTLVMRVVIPAAILALAMFFVFGAGVTDAFARALSHSFLSGNATNLPWISTYALRLLLPETGGLAHGHVEYLHVAGLAITVHKLFFFAGYLPLCVRHARGPKTFLRTLTYCILGFLWYYGFNIGVHENHLFVPAILAAILYWKLPALRLPCLIIITMNSINLILFYGISGEGLGFSRVAGIDITVPVALLNVVFIIYFCRFVWRHDANLFGESSPHTGKAAGNS